MPSRSCSIIEICEHILTEQIGNLRLCLRFDLIRDVDLGERNPIPGIISGIRSNGEIR